MLICKNPKCELPAASNSSYCTDTCRHKYHNNTANAARKALPITCEVCKKVFHTKIGKFRGCSVECNEVIRLKHHAHRIERAKQSKMNDSKKLPKKYLVRGLVLNYGLSSNAV